MKRVVLGTFILFYGALSQGMSARQEVDYRAFPRIHLSGVKEQDESTENVKNAVFTGRTNPSVWEKLPFFPNLERLSLAETIQEVPYGFTKQEELNCLSEHLLALSHLRVLNLCHWPVEQSHLDGIPGSVELLELFVPPGKKYDFTRLEERGVTIVIHKPERPKGSVPRPQEKSRKGSTLPRAPKK